ncbi:MAG: hypothetical protein HC871_10330 [Rhizobiales bacterium]|nr:hypothetical protein [Hyphomicrobiales bacterium]
MGARAVIIRTSKGDIYRFHHMVGREEISRLFGFDLTLISDSDQEALEDMLGDSLTVELELEDGQVRHVNGYVSQFTYLGTEGSHARYLAKIRPWLWFLTRSTDCRIFQNKTVPEIVRQVFQAYSTAVSRPADRRLSGARLLRSVSGKRLRFRQPPHGIRGHLLFLRACGRQAHPGSDR